jgi:hypothetical protein
MTNYFHKNIRQLEAAKRRHERRIAKIEESDYRTDKLQRELAKTRHRIKLIDALIVAKKLQMPLGL